MEVSARIVTLELAETFVISRSASDTEDVVVVELRHSGVSGFGEAQPHSHYGESVGSAQAYLFQATRNRVLNHLRHLRIEQRTEPELRGEGSSTPPADAALVQEELSTAVQLAVQALPDRCREVFELSRVHGLKYAEIARTLGISVKTVEAQMGKALRTLRERLASWLPDEGG